MACLRAAVLGLGNIGACALNSLLAAPDFSCAGVVRRSSSLGSSPHLLRGVPEYGSLDELIAAQGKPDVALVCCPSRRVPDEVKACLAKGLPTVDSFDIHSAIRAQVETLDALAKAAGVACVTAAGWDPGTDSALRALFEAMVPVGATFTNFGRGRSMGHSVAARALPGVADAVSITIPIGGGRHSRLVYILPQPGAAFDDICARLAADPYFCHDPLDIREVKSAAELALVADNSHGVLLERTGSSGCASNQRLSFDMRIDNPALTAQVLVAAARAATRLPAGCHTLIDIPPVALLPGERLDNIERLV